MDRSSGFTTVELLALIVFVALVGSVGYDRYQAVQTVHRDHDRKIAVNAIYHNLEEIVRPTLGGYPKTLQATQLKAMDKALLRDPQGHVVGSNGSDYRYEPSGCSGGDICQHFTLSANLENENDYVKTSKRD